MKHIIPLLILLSTSVFSAEPIVVTPIGKIIVECKDPVVAFYHTVLKDLADNGLESGTKHVLNPASFMKKYSSYIERVGDEAFKKKSIERLGYTVFYKISQGNKHLLVVGPTKKKMGANLFVENSDHSFIFDSEMDSKHSQELFNKYRELRENK
jgi:hypothetical protein